jgi:macrolide transport system ATP-binding/permease protein
LDELTNFLDIPTREELENVLSSYPGTLLFASHDRKLIAKVATHLLLMENHQITYFAGTYEEYVKGKNTLKEKGNVNKLLLLQHELTEIVSRLSLPIKNEEKADLERRYQDLLKQIKLTQTKKGG